MSVSFDSKEEKEAAAAARVLTPVIVERPKSAMQARRSLLIRMLALIEGCQKYVSIQHKIATHPFQISMDEAKAMHICQALRDVDELSASAQDPHSSSDGHTSSMRFTSEFF